MPSKTCCVTGLRKIPPKKADYITQSLRKEIQRAIEEGYTGFLSDFSDGVSLLFATIVADLKQMDPGLYLEAALPYRSRVWTGSAQFRRMLGKCNAIGVHGENYSPACLMNGSHYMVDNSQRIIAVYNGCKKDGTLNTMNYARATGKDVRLIAL